ncbi:MAG TPA: class I SAM-dependent methyltransferase [Gaiellaceae bacterium]
MNADELGKRFARVVTNAVVRRPALWRLFRAPLRRQFESLAPGWDERRTPGRTEAYEAALAALPAAPRRALDLGTGTGDGALALARRFPEAEVVGADLAAAMVAEARRKTPPELDGRVRFEVADAASLPFEDGEFDLVAMNNMIPFFDELARVLAPGGRVVFAFSGGAQTPIYVPPGRLRRELSARGFTEFAEFSVGAGTALAAKLR